MRWNTRLLGLSTLHSEQPCHALCTLRLNLFYVGCLQRPKQWLLFWQISHTQLLNLDISAMANLCQSWQTHQHTHTYHERWTWKGMLLYRYGKAILYSVLTGCLMMILLMSLNSFQSSSLQAANTMVANCPEGQTTINELLPSLLKRELIHLRTWLFKPWARTGQIFQALPLVTGHQWDRSLLPDVAGATFHPPNTHTPLHTHSLSLSFTRGSNFGPPGIAKLRAFAVKNDFRSKR